MPKVEAQRDLRYLPAISPLEPRSVIPRLKGAHDNFRPTSHTPKAATARTLALFGAFSLAIFLSPTVAAACPDIDRLVDINCDGKLVILTFGDSITYGVGDSKRLGYPGRLRRLLPNAQIHNFGDPGEKTPVGRRRAPVKFKRYKGKADYVIILEGVNDYWDAFATPLRTRANVMAMADAAKGTGGLVLIGKLLATRRTFQIPWVQSVNAALGNKAELDFYALGTSILTSDGLHPSGPGYSKMATLVEKALRRKGARHRPVDRDHDGLYDFAERKYGADLHLRDTDGDGLLDGEEVFRYRSKPYLLDSDGDGFTDPFEVNTLRSDPANARPTSPTLKTIEAIP